MPTDAKPLRRAFLALLALAAVLAPAPAAGEPVFMQVDEPLDGARIGGAVALLPVAGRVGRGENVKHDIVIVIDTSGSAFWPSEEDLDGDGHTGQWRSPAIPSRTDGMPKSWTTDFDDTVVQAELTAARHLVTLLNPEYVRVGLIKFGGSPYLQQPVGPLDAVLGALERFRFSMRGATDFAEMVRMSVKTLRAAPFEPERRMRTLILLSDGQSSPPLGRRGLSQLRAALEVASRASTRIYAFGVGPQAVDAPSLLRLMARNTGGRFFPVREPADVRHELPMVSLAGLSDVEIQNTTSGADGRAIRVFPDGSFDGYAPLVPGKNELRITATIEDGRQVTRSIAVEYEPPATPDAADLASARELLERLKDRTVETDLARRAQEERRARRLKALEIRIE